MKTIGERFGNPYAYARSLMRNMDDRSASIMMDSIVANWDEIKDRVAEE